MEFWKYIATAFGGIVFAVLLTNWKRIFNIFADTKVNTREVENLKNLLTERDKIIEGKLEMFIKLAISEFRNEFQKLMSEYAKNDDIKELSDKINKLDKDITKIKTNVDINNIYSQRITERVEDLENGYTHE